MKQIDTHYDVMFQVNKYKNSNTIHFVFVSKFDSKYGK
jgi:hypothetical protein